nr:spidroin-1-like [Aegilops tauschii subsp. strangulata]
MRGAGGDGAGQVAGAVAGKQLQRGGAVGDGALGSRRHDACARGKRRPRQSGTRVAGGPGAAAGGARASRRSPERDSDERAASGAGVDGRGGGARSEDGRSDGMGRRCQRAPRAQWGSHGRGRHSWSARAWPEPSTGGGQGAAGEEAAGACRANAHALRRGQEQGRGDTVVHGRARV